MALIGRFFQPPEASYFLFGPRGTGKSTFLREALADALWVDLLRPELEQRFVARPERLRELVDGEPDAKVVVVDEVQKAPALLNVVHDLLARRGRSAPRFVLTGSSARKLRRTGVNLLAGRLLLERMHPFMAAELPSFDLGLALRRGLLPVVWDSDTPDATLSAYVALYIREEVQAEGLVRRLDHFGRFVERVSFSHGAVLNIAEVARETHASRKTVEAYIGILEDLHLAFRLPVFRRRQKRQLTVHPKFYWFDAGVFRSVRPAGPLDRPEEIEGGALEGLVAQHLRAWLDYSGSGATLSFWRTKSGNEVDFVVYGEEGLWAFEVQNSGSVRSRDLRGLRAFLEDYPAAQARLLYRGDERLEIQGIRCEPCEEYLAAIRPGVLLR
ncbi:MAG: ATP-binding protein [Holophagales bacterium]|nr:ATP-binding protein [Holophagales bacterium]MYG29700.1 ATP-binding protein [Holophagales bacterium]MYI79782.1 ATP-binding protein [Holophagales bacterium]